MTSSSSKKVAYIIDQCFLIFNPVKCVIEQGEDISVAKIGWLVKIRPWGFVKVFKTYFITQLGTWKRTTKGVWISQKVISHFSERIVSLSCSCLCFALYQIFCFILLKIFETSNSTVDFWFDLRLEFDFHNNVLAMLPKKLEHIFLIWKF